MLKRSITAVILVGFVVAMMYLGATVSYYFLDALIMIFACLGMYEIYKSLKSSGHSPMLSPVIVAIVSIYPAWILGGIDGLLAAFFISMIVAMSVFTLDKNRGIDSIFSTLFAILYPYLLFSIAFMLDRDYCGIFSLGFAVFVAVSTDTFAYLVGSMLGKHKLCPDISPKKTVEGAIGGLFGGIFMSVVFFFLFEYFALFDSIGYVKFTDNLGWSAVIYVALGIIGGVLSQLGDLFASKIKRQLGIKDFGNIFPGHGGALDRVDSIMYMLVMLFAAFQLIY